MDLSPTVDERRSSFDNGEKTPSNCSTFCDRCVEMCSKMEKCLANEEEKEAARLAWKDSCLRFEWPEYQEYDSFKLDSSSEEMKASACGICRAIEIAISGKIGEWTREMESPIFEWSRSLGSFVFDCSTRKFGTSLTILTSSFVESYPPLSDLERVRDWTEDCSAFHNRCTFRQQETLQGLRVIDCIQRIVVLAPGKCDYVALSYVWGKAGNMPLQEAYDLKAKLPATIEDSITTTLVLGYQYLWVDKYRVQQHDSRDKHIQIQQLDLIYSSAQITLIGAAGEDCTYGLPGVGRKRIFPDISIDLVPVTLGFELEASSVASRIEYSTWSTRAWTLQEGYLSRRRLYFTDYEILFVCNESTENEFISSGREASVNNLKFTFPTSNQKSASALSKGIGLLEKYSARSLSFQSDALNAVLGIFNSLRD